MKTKRKKFTVVGNGEFPFDMLRYDECWPASEEQDSFKLQSPYTKDEGLKRREVTLLTMGIIYLEGHQGRERTSLLIAAHVP